jgi:hypothetical protein
VHRLPATWPPERYQDWTSTSKQTMTFQDTRAGVRPFLIIVESVPLRHAKGINHPMADRGGCRAL